MKEMHTFRGSAAILYDMVKKACVKLRTVLCHQFYSLLLASFCVQNTITYTQ